jgi:hypothetical protein
LSGPEPVVRSVSTGLTGTSGINSPLKDRPQRWRTHDRRSDPIARGAGLERERGGHDAADDCRVESVVDPGAGNGSIQFLACGTSSNTLVLHTGGADHVSGFDPSSDVLDLRSLLAEANVNLNGGSTRLSNYLTVTDQRANALLSFDPTGHGGGSTIAVLVGLGPAISFRACRDRKPAPCPVTTEYVSVLAGWYETNRRPFWRRRVQTAFFPPYLRTRRSACSL